MSMVGVNGSLVYMRALGGRGGGDGGGKGQLGTTSQWHCALVSSHGLTITQLFIYLCV